MTSGARGEGPTSHGWMGDPRLEPRILHSDEWLAVVDKPAGLIVHPAAGHSGPTLVEALGDVLGGGEDPQRPGIVHRLDRDTSGLMLVARGDEAHRRLAAEIGAREVNRTYLALVEGRPRSRSGTIDAPLGRDYRAPERRAVGGRGPREARTHFTVLEPLPADSLVVVRLETGRTHQIRAHFAAIGTLGVTASRASSCTARGSGSATRSRGRRSSSPRRCRMTWPRRWSWRGRGSQG